MELASLMRFGEWDDPGALVANVRCWGRRFTAGMEKLIFLFEQQPGNWTTNGNCICRFGFQPCSGNETQAKLLMQDDVVQNFLLISQRNKLCKHFWGRLGEARPCSTIYTSQCWLGLYAYDAIWANMRTDTRCSMVMNNKLQTVFWTTKRPLF